MQFLIDQLLRSGHNPSLAEESLQHQLVRQGAVKGPCHTNPHWSLGQLRHDPCERLGLEEVAFVADDCGVLIEVGQRHLLEALPCRNNDSLVSLLLSASHDPMDVVSG